jgi:Putative Flp pilus-assembly TadE/G-like
MHAQRGQTLPVWTFGVLASLMLAFMVFNYGNSLRWQIRAQNAADAVAQGVMSVQAQHYNQMNITLHAAAIEEYRIRRTMNALLLVLRGNGGCVSVVGGTPVDCAAAYQNLRANYIADVNRYTQLVQQMAQVTEYSPTQQQADMAAIVAQFQNSCVTGGSTGGDCVFKYTISTPTARPNLSGAEVDAAGENNGDGLPLPSLPADLQPLQIEVSACAQINLPFQSFFHMNTSPFYAIGRAGAASAMVTQEWNNPGVMINPNSPGGNKPFQPVEYPESATNTIPPSYSASNGCTAAAADYDWYAVHWCANSYNAIYAPPPGNPGGFAGIINSDEYSVWTGWWSALPVAPVATFTPTSSNCSLGVPSNS